ncbi:MAG: TIGR03668 family PPOX class F420-dependent oxidoreductase [Acidimicrobiales bacterium]
MDDELMRQRLGLASGGPAGHDHCGRVSAPGAVLLRARPAAVGDVIWSAVDAKPKSTLALRRLANVAAHPVATLLVDHYAEDWARLWWVRVDGGARIVEAGSERDEAITRLTGKYQQYRRTPPPGPVLAIDVTAWTAWGSGSV